MAKLARFAQGVTFTSGNVMYRFERPSFTRRNGKLIFRKNWWHLMKMDEKKGRHVCIDMHVDDIRALMETVSDAPRQLVLTKAEQTYGCNRTNAFLRPRGWMPPSRQSIC